MGVDQNKISVIEILANALIILCTYRFNQMNEMNAKNYEWNYWHY